MLNTVQLIHSDHLDRTTLAKHCIYPIIKKCYTNRFCTRLNRVKTQEFDEAKINKIFSKKLLNQRSQNRQHGKLLLQWRAESYISVID